MTIAPRRPQAASEAPAFSLLPQPSVKPVRREFRLQPGGSLGLVLLLVMYLSSCGGSDPKPASARASVAQVVPASVATAERRDMPYYLTGLGSVNAYYTVNVKSRVDGELVQVNFKEGQDRKKAASCWR